MKYSASALVLSGLFMASSSVSAFPISLDSVSGSWHSAQGGSDVNGENTDGIFWGHGTGDGQSGYGFQGSQDLPAIITDGEAFTLGTMTHYNRRITGDAIQGVSLDVMAGFSGEGDSLETGPYTFNFTHDETPNTGCGKFTWLCAIFKPSWNDVDDVIYLDEMITSSEFQVGTKVYSMNLLGFENGITSVETPEGENTSINLLASLNVSSVKVTEPGTLALLGLGLAGLAFAGGRRRRI